MGKPMNVIIYAILSLKSNPERLTALLAGMKGIAGAGLHFVSSHEISVVVGEINRSDVIANQSNALEYASVVESISEQFTLLPVRFGSVLDSTDAIIKMVEKNYPDIQLNLQKVENKFEFGLKILCDSEKLKAELTAKYMADADIPGKTSPEIKNSPSREWVNRKLTEHRIEELLLSHIDKLIAVITASFDQLDTIHKFKKMATSAIIIDAVFLLDKGKKDALIRTVSDLQSQFPGLNFVLTGPWPPYNFVDFKIK